MRGKIKDARNARNTAEKIGGIFKGYYSATEVAAMIKYFLKL